MQVDKRNASFGKWAPLAVLIVAAGAFLIHFLNKPSKEPPQVKPPAQSRSKPADSGPSQRTGRQAALSNNESKMSFHDPADDLKEETAKRIAAFESNVLWETRASRVRVETPQLLALSGRTPAQQPAGSQPGLADRSASSGALEESGSPFGGPGYVAFMIRPEGMAEGVHLTMENIARHYFEQFKDAPQVTVSLIVGGGVRDRRTFFNNGDGAVSAAGGDLTSTDSQDQGFHEAR
ncbi:MAG: hypothetical protein GX443_11585 [Deltaproteobacteria bacterium]|nr:hypothetical protein [Deltaproteobacteria bacterium]